jgi:hypothetical protein
MSEERKKAKEEAREEAPVREREEVRSVQEAWREFQASLRALLPEEFWEHRRAARREALLAVRSLIDAALERIEEEERAERPKRAKKIEIE